jgi:hypothetical protein
MDSLLGYFRTVKYLSKLRTFIKQDRQCTYKHNTETCSRNNRCRGEAISIKYYDCKYDFSGPGSSVGIATGYGLDGPGIDSRWRRDFPHLSRPALGPTQPPVQWGTGSFLGVKSGRGVTLTTHPLLVSVSRKDRAIPLLPLWAVRPVQSLSRVELYLYSPCGPYDLYRASVQ